MAEQHVSIAEGFTKAFAGLSEQDQTKLICAIQELADTAGPNTDLPAFAKWLEKRLWPKEDN